MCSESEDSLIQAVTSNRVTFSVGTKSVSAAEISSSISVSLSFTRRRRRIIGNSKYGLSRTDIAFNG